MSALVLTLGLAGSALGVAAYGVFSPRSRLFGPLLYRGPKTASSGIALTFDDGPSLDATPRILDALDECGVRAAFFVIGANAEQRPGLVERMAREGHVVANHSYDHAAFGMFRGDSYWHEQLSRTDAVIEAIIGRRPALFRPPMGMKQPELMRALQACGHTTVTWSQRGFDGIPTSAERIVSRLAPRVRDGDVIALHDGFQRAATAGIATAQALPRLIAALRARHLEPKRLDELLQIRAYR